MKVRVRYWRGTTQQEGTATTYAGAMRIASKNANAYGPSFWDEHGEQLHDDGAGLAYEETEEDRQTGIRRYAVQVAKHPAPTGRLTSGREGLGVETEPVT